MRVCCGLRPMLCVLGCSASAGSIGSERSAVSLPGVTLDSWIGEQEAGTARQEECLGLAQTFCRNLCGEDRLWGRGGFRQGTWQKEVPEYQKQVIAGPEGICQITLPSPSFYRRGNCVSERSKTDPRPHSHQNSPFLTTVCHNDLPQLYCNVLCEPVHTAHTRCIHKQHMQCWCAHG